MIEAFVLDGVALRMAQAQLRGELFREKPFVMDYQTSITLVMAIPTVISGLYGMNVNGDGMPFANSYYGFAIVCLITLVVSAFTMLILRRKKML